MLVDAGEGADLGQRVLHDWRRCPGTRRPASRTRRPDRAAAGHRSWPAGIRCRQRPRRPSLPLIVVQASGPCRGSRAARSCRSSCRSAFRPCRRRPPATRNRQSPQLSQSCQNRPIFTPRFVLPSPVSFASDADRRSGSTVAMTILPERQVPCFKKQNRRSKIQNPAAALAGSQTWRPSSSRTARAARRSGRPRPFRPTLSAWRLIFSRICRRSPPPASRPCMISSCFSAALVADGDQLLSFGRR